MPHVQLPRSKKRQMGAGIGPECDGGPCDGKCWEGGGRRGALAVSSSSLLRSSSDEDDDSFISPSSEPWS